MTYSEFEFKTNEGSVLMAREWLPDREPLGMVCLVHGLGEHSGRYGHLASALNQAGYVLRSYDQRGHGKSIGKRGHTPSYETLLDDIYCFSRDSIQRYPNLPVFLYGHSLGGNLVLNYVIRRQPKFAGVVVTSPWLRLSIEPPPWLRTFAIVLDKFMPTFSLPSKLELAALSHDPNEINAYNSDPLVHNRISVHLFVAVDQAGRWALDNASRFALPLLLMHGGGDRITATEATRVFATYVQKDCTLKIWPDLYHELHNELEKEEIISCLINWIEAHTRHSQH